MSIPLNILCHVKTVRTCAVWHTRPFNRVYHSCGFPFSCSATTPRPHAESDRDARPAWPIRSTGAPATPGGRGGRARALPAGRATKSSVHVASAQVAPIAKARGWVVQHFMEFLPAEAGLLGINVNRGQEIKIRRSCLLRCLSAWRPPLIACAFAVRRHDKDTTFLEYRDLVGTTLHELAHMVGCSFDFPPSSAFSHLPPASAVLAAHWSPR